MPLIEPATFPYTFTWCVLTVGFKTLGTEGDVLLGDDEVLLEELVDGVLFLRLFFCRLFVSRSTQPFFLGVDSFFFFSNVCLKQIPVFKVGAWFSGFFLPLMIYSLYSSPLAALADLQMDHVEPIFNDSPDLSSLPFWLNYYVLGLLWGLLCCPLFVVCQTSLLPLLGVEWILLNWLHTLYNVVPSPFCWRLKRTEYPGARYYIQ